MSELQFPSRLKPIVSKGYGQNRGGNIWRQEVQGGLPRQGRDTYFEAVPISVTLVVSKLARQVFWTFIRQIDGGASSFLMNHDTGNGIEPHSVLITSQINEQTQNGVYWTITFTATAERTSIQEDDGMEDILPPLYDEYGEGLQQYLAAVKTRVTTYPFINDLPEATSDPKRT